MAINKREIFLIGACEVTAGAIEAIFIPNIGKGKGEKFHVPGKKEIFATALTLTATGAIAGYAADSILSTYKIGDDKPMKRALVIAGTVFLFNALEAILIDNIVDHMTDFKKYTFPTFHKFASNLSFLAFTGLAVGLVSSHLISATAPALTPTQTLQKDISQILVDQTPAELDKTQEMAISSQ